MINKVETNKREFKDVVTAWDWLNLHPAFDFEAREIVLSPKKKWMKKAGVREKTRVWFQDNTFAESLSVDFVRVNPQTGAIDNDDSKNTQIEVWLEAGGPVEDESLGKRYRVSHDYKLDCGGPTFEIALLQMAGNVLEVYGDYEVDGHAISL
jgi:hypothetical protein